MTFLDWVARGVLGLLGLYLVARLVSAAWYRSKYEYENWKRKIR